MGQGYATLPKQRYVPAAAELPDDVILQYDAPEVVENNQRPEKKVGRPVIRHEFNPGEHRQSVGHQREGKNGHNDGEWMYNLDQLATEHSGRGHRKSHVSAPERE